MLPDSFLTAHFRYSSADSSVMKSKAWFQSVIRLISMGLRKLSEKNISQFSFASLTVNKGLRLAAAEDPGYS